MLKIAKIAEISKIKGINFTNTKTKRILCNISFTLYSRDSYNASKQQHRKKYLLISYDPSTIKTIYKIKTRRLQF